MSDEPLSEIDLFWSFRSPYSYLAIPGARLLEVDFKVRVHFRPVLPLAVREPGFFSPDNLKRARYIALDWLRRAEMLGMPHAWPSPDPIAQDLKTFKVAAEQPHIHRLTWLGVEAQRRGQGLAFAGEVSSLIFGGTRGWNEGTRLAEATARAGLDLRAMEAAIADPSSHQAEVEASQAALAASGHWGVPTFVYNGEPFFGEDRIDTLRWRLGKQGLARV
ncbi:MAG: 2-hydroxychromene-2-carboxylate isomerase [Burkholderiales bacterium]